MALSSTQPERANVYTRITAEIVAAIEAGAGRWRMPWHHDGTSTARPTNLASSRRYRGINTLALWIAAQASGYGEGLWGTYRQWQAAGSQVRRGERATTVVLWKEVRSAGDEEGAAEDDGGGRRRMFARAFSVFNRAQVASNRPKHPSSRRRSGSLKPTPSSTPYGSRSRSAPTMPITVSGKTASTCRRSRRSRTRPRMWER